MHRSSFLIPTSPPSIRPCNSRRAAFRAALLPGKMWTWPPRSSNKRAPRTLTSLPSETNLSTPSRSSSDSLLLRSVWIPPHCPPFHQCLLPDFRRNCWNGGPILPGRKEESLPPTNRSESHGRLFFRQSLWDWLGDSRAGNFQIG